MTSQDKNEFGIIGGPKKFDLMFSLFDGNNITRRTVDFEITKVTRIRVAIIALQRANSSGESWNFEGVHWKDPGYKVTGHFNTDERRGHLCFGSPLEATKVQINAFNRFIKTLRS